MRTLQQLVQQAGGSSEWLSLLGAQLDQQAKDLPEPVKIYPRLVATYLAAAIPPQTAFIEPFVRVRGKVDWTGLFVGQMD